MDLVNFLESLFRWIHVIAGILWIGLLYFFNWVNTAFAPTMDAETKKKMAVRATIRRASRGMVILRLILSYRSTVALVDRETKLRLGDDR